MRKSKKSSSIEKVINVLGKNYSVVFEAQDGFDGTCDKLNKIIRINPNLEGDDLLDTLLHEVFHAVMHESKLDRVISHEIEELVVYHVTQAAMEVIFKTR